MPILNPLKKHQKAYTKKVKGLRTLYTVLKGEKVHNFYTFMLIGNFFYELNFYEQI